MFASLANEAPPQNETMLSAEGTSAENVNNEGELGFEAENTLVPIIVATKVALNECIGVSFDDSGVVEYYYIPDGVNVMEAALCRSS